MGYSLLSNLPSPRCCGVSRVAQPVFVAMLPCRQWYTDVPQNLRVENGKLVLQVSPLSLDACQGD